MALRLHLQPAIPAPPPVHTPAQLAGRQPNHLSCCKLAQARIKRHHRQHGRISAATCAALAAARSCCCCHAVVIPRQQDDIGCWVSRAVQAGLSTNVGSCLYARNETSTIKLVSGSHQITNLSQIRRRQPMLVLLNSQQRVDVCCCRATSTNAVLPWPAVACCSHAPEHLNFNIPTVQAP